MELINIGGIATAKHNIILGLCDYLKRNSNIKNLIIGISGGIDSAVVATLAIEAIRIMKTSQFYHNRELKLIGRSLPIETNMQDEIDRAQMVGLAICDEFQTNNMTEEYDIFRQVFMDEENEILKKENGLYKYAVRSGNIKARMRMIYLYHLASLHNGMVLSTDNLTEYLLGFWTLHGDVGDFGMIQNLWKTEVYELANYFIREYSHNDMAPVAEALSYCVDATPTDGLGITDSDLDQFGDVNSYEDVDKILLEKVNDGYDGFIKRNEISKVLVMHENTHFKRENPYNIPREDILGGIL